MSRRHEIYIVRAVTLQAEHYISELVNSNLFSNSAARYFAILAKYALERTPRKEDSSRSALTADYGFLPHMKRGARYIYVGRHTAKSDRSVPIHSAFSRAEGAGLISVIHTYLLSSVLRFRVFFFNIDIRFHL